MRLAKTVAAAVKVSSATAGAEKPAAASRSRSGRDGRGSARDTRRAKSSAV